MTEQTQLATLESKMQRLDKFAEENSLAIILDGKGAFSSMLAVSTAMNELRAMLTEDVMKPIMDCQGLPTGFRTDKDSSGGYKLEIVREVVIEAALKGFQMVGNQTNIIGGRFYATKEGFEAFFKKLSAQKKFSDLRTGFSVPKITSEGAVVTCFASWTFNGIQDELKNVEIPIRVNAGMGPDAILGKARRKLLAQIYTRITGSEITEGDASEPNTINVDAKVSSQTVAEGLSPDEISKIKAICEPKAASVNAWLKSKNLGATWEHITPKLARQIIKDPEKFLHAVEVDLK